MGGANAQMIPTKKSMVRRLVMPTNIDYGAILRRVEPLRH
jgi:hypothetical protein